MKKCKTSTVEDIGESVVVVDVVVSQVDGLCCSNYMGGFVFRY